MTVDYRDRNYIVYKGQKISEQEILDIITSSKYKSDKEKITIATLNNEVTFFRNNILDKDSEQFIIDYFIHFYRDYTYLYDFDVDSLMKYQQAENDNTVNYPFYGGYYGFKDILQYAGIDDKKSYELLPKLLTETNKNDIAYFLLELYTPDNLSYVLYDQKTNELEAITIQNKSLQQNNYDGIYYSLTNTNEEMFSNNPDLLLEFSNNIEQLPQNSVLKNKKVRKIKW